jgi:predicted  nucleic acid-binding Zn-ribbon protein
MNQSELSPLEKAIARKLDQTKDKASQPGYLRKLVAKLHLRIEAALARGCEYDDLAESITESGVKISTATLKEKIVRAKLELEESVEAYTTQIVDTSNWINEQLMGQLQSVQKNQQKLDTKLVEVLEGLMKEHRNLQTISTGLVNATSVLLKKQQELVIQTEEAGRYARLTVVLAVIVLITSFLGLVFLCWFIQN